jgi:peptide/nickel transport system substrate-binding protein
MTRFFALLPIVALVVAACAAPSTPPGAATTSGPKRGGTFVFAIRAEPGVLNPAFDVDADPASIGANVYNALVRQNLDLSVTPSLAERWEISPDGKTYSFSLRRGVTWHDGKPFTSADVKFSIEDVVLPYHSQGRAMFSVVDRIDTPDDLTVRFTLKNAFPPFLQYLTLDGLPVYPKHLWAGTDIQKNPLNSAPVGTGPFVFKEWVRGDHVTLERNPSYWIKDRPYVDRIVVRFIQDPNARIQALEAGEVDALFGFIPVSEFLRLAKDPRFQTTRQGSERLASISTNMCFNLAKAPFSNIDVRRAIASALDKDLISDKATFGTSKVAKSHIPQGLQWSNPDARQYPHDVRNAETLLDAAGLTKNASGTRFRMTLKWNASDPEHQKVGEVSQQLLKAVGIDVQIQPTEVAAFENQIFVNYDFDATLRTIGTGPDPVISAMWRAYHSSNIRPVRLLNNTRFRNARVDELFDKSAVEADQLKRNAYFKEIQAILMDELPCYPILEKADPKIWKATWDGDVVAGPALGLRNSWDNIWKK